MAGSERSRERCVVNFPAEVGASDSELLRAVVAHYRSAFERSPAVQEAVRKWGVSAEAMAHFEFGFGDRTLGPVLPGRRLKAGRWLREQLGRLGVLKESGHELFRGAVTVPLFDAHGHVVQLCGRELNGGPRAELLWLPGGRRGLCNVSAVTSSKTVVVTNAVLDAVTWWSHGHRNVTSLQNPEDLLPALQCAQVERVMVAFPRDEAGREASEELVRALQVIGVGVWLV